MGGGSKVVGYVMWGTVHVSHVIHNHVRATVWGNVGVYRGAGKGGVGLLGSKGWGWEWEGVVGGKVGLQAWGGCIGEYPNPWEYNNVRRGGVV